MSCIVGSFVLLFPAMLFGLVQGHFSYSIPEEKAKGSVIGNIAQDLGLSLQRLKSGKASLHAGDSAEYIGLDKETGTLFIKEKMDRESLCAKTTTCALHFQLILETPMELYTIAVEITDINDNPPIFQKKQIEFEIMETAITGSRFVLDDAVDADVGINDLQSYSLKPTDNFILDQHKQANDKTFEMVLQKPLDREKKGTIDLLLTATDGGNPQLSGTVQIHVTVIDANDNAPVFTQKVYKATLTENAAKGFKLISVSASDADEALYGQVSYYISGTEENVQNMFVIDQQKGEVILNGHIDYEKHNHYEIKIQAKDQGSLSDSCKLIIDVLDINDNRPVIKLLSMSKSVPEDAKPETVVAMLKVDDADSGKNGQVHCFLEDNTPFALVSPSSNFISLQTEKVLDREIKYIYNISVTCSDEGTPSLSSSISLILQVSDINDNAPLFEKSEYEAMITENNTPGLSIITVKASDSDWNQNARLSYLLEDSTANGVSVSSYVSVHPDSGVITALRSFDFEQLKNFNLRVKAQDGGSPPLSNNVTVKVIIQDQNDNAPQVLYPVETGVSVVAEIVPRAADVGYLVTKVVAVDVDSGQNAWLSYKLQKSTDRALFEVGLQNGEIRTVRQVTDKDAVKQKLTVVVEDNGQPSRSAVVTINVAVADSFPEVLSEFTDFTQDKEYKDSLTFYLVLALTVVSLLFIVSIISIVSVKIYRWRQNKFYSKSGTNLPVIPYYPPVYADGTLQQVYNYEMCGTTDSRMSDVKFVRPYSQNTLLSQSRVGTVQRKNQEEEVDHLDDEVRQYNI